MSFFISISRGSVSRSRKVCQVCVKKIVKNCSEIITTVWNCKSLHIYCTFCISESQPLSCGIYRPLAHDVFNIVLSLACSTRCCWGTTWWSQCTPRGTPCTCRSVSLESQTGQYLKRPIKVRTALFSSWKRQFKDKSKTIKIILCLVTITLILLATASLSLSWQMKVCRSISIIPGTVTLTSLILCSTEQLRTTRPSQSLALPEYGIIMFNLLNGDSNKNLVTSFVILKFFVPENTSSSSCFLLPLERSRKRHFSLKKIEIFYLYKWIAPKSRFQFHPDMKMFKTFLIDCF